MCEPIIYNSLKNHYQRKSLDKFELLHVNDTFPKHNNYHLMHQKQGFILSRLPDRAVFYIYPMHRNFFHREAHSLMTGSLSFFWIQGILCQKEEEGATDARRGRLAQKGEKALQRRLGRRQPRLHYQKWGEVPRSIRDRFVNRWVLSSCFFHQHNTFQSVSIQLSPLVYCKNFFLVWTSSRALKYIALGDTVSSNWENS